MVWSNEQTAWWRSRQSAYLQDRSAVEQDQALDLERARVRQEILQALNSFLEGATGLRAFNATFQQQTHSNWNVFYLRGMSGGLFFNQLVQCVPNEETFAHLLRLMVRVPDERREAEPRMQAFVRFLEGLISSQQVQRAQLQPARVPFFQSVWWHIQAQEQWPIFYADVRRAFLAENVSGSLPPDPVEAYFSFSASFLALAQELGISSWELEHLCRWSLKRDLPPGAGRGENQPSPASRMSKRSSLPKQTCMLVRRAGEKSKQPPGDKEGGEAVACRTHLQWLLAKLGHKVGCRVWIAANDHGKACQRERLGNLSLPTLPLLADTSVQQVIRQIDVLWLLDNEVVVAYESRSSVA